MLLAVALYLGIYKNMKAELKDFTWDKYFKQVDIYQGRSHWTALKHLLLKLKNKW